MSRFNRVSSISQQEKQKIIFVTSNSLSTGSSSKVFNTRPGIYKLDSQFNYNVSFDTKDPVSKIAFNTSGALDIKIDNSFNIYAVGNFTQFRGLPNNRIIKLLPNGSKDTSFDNATGFNSTVSKVYLDTNNKIYCFGAFTTYKGVPANRIIRLNSDGSKDTTFDNTTGFINGNVLDYTVDSLGKIYCVGTFTSYKGVSCGRIAKINTDGTLDTSFNFGGTGFSSTQVTNICIDNNDKIYVGGNFNQYNGVNANGIIRLNNDGTIDNGFNYGSGFLPLVNQLVKNIKVDVDNNLYVSIQNFSSTKYKNSTNSNGLWKIDPSGNTISNLNYPPNDVSGPQNIVFTNDNKIIMDIDYNNGFSSDVPYNVILTDLNGNKIKNLFYTYNDYDISYDVNNNYYIYGSFTDDGVFNRIFSMGYPISENGLLLPKKFNQNYGLTSGGTSSSETNIIITSDNKLIYGNNIYSYNFKENRNFLKLTLNGSVDNRFNTGSGFDTLNIGSNSKIDSDLNGDLFVISSTFTKYKNETIRSSSNNCTIIKIDKNGNRDTTFQPVITNTNAFSTQQMWFQKNDNKLIWIANRGSNVTISGNTYNGIVRFNNNGLIDTTFSGRTWSSSPSISASYLHNDNKLYLKTSSNGLTYDGIPVGCICRLNNDGSLDQTFNTSIQSIGVDGIFVDKYDKVWAYGSFTTYSGITNNRIIRLNSDGTIDSTFDNSIGFNSSVVDMCFDNDNDKTYFLGGFTTYKNISVPYLASLNYNGSINSTFTTPKNNGYGTGGGKIFIFDS